MAAFLVAAFHFTRKLAGLDLVFPFGWVGVEIFFVISGYVIAYSARQTEPMRFLESRFFRLYPTAWIVAGISFSILSIVPSYYWRTINVSVFTDPANVLNSVALSGIGLSGSYWTLPVELAFYACIFLLLLAGRACWLRDVALVLTLYSAPYVTLLGLHHLQIVDAAWVEFNLSLWNASLIRHGAFFALGMYLFSACDLGLRVRERCGVGLAVLLCLVEIACRGAEQLHGNAVSDQIPLELLIAESETVFVLALAAMVAALRWNDAFPSRWRRLSRAFGVATYPFYLVHEVLGGLTVYLLLRAGAPPAVAVAGALSVVGAAALVISAWIEPSLRRSIASSLARRSSGGKSDTATLGAT